MTRGYAHLPCLAPPALVAALQAEAIECLANATPVSVPQSDGPDGRGGNPRRCLLTAPAGPVQTGWYHSPALHLALQRISGATLCPTGGGGTFSYYIRPGDHITIHRDILTCDFTLITCVFATPGSGNAGNLVFWPTRRGETLASIRANPGPGAELLNLQPGHSALLFGGLIPHAVLPVGAHQQRIASLLCFQAQ
jgi:hypothetical protein